MNKSSMIGKGMGGMGGGSSGTSPANIILIEWVDGTTLNIVFDKAVTLALGSFTTLDITGQIVIEILAGNGTTTIQVGLSDSVASDAAWTWTNDGGLATPAINLPASGTVEFGG